MHARSKGFTRVYYVALVAVALSVAGLVLFWWQKGTREIKQSRATAPENPVQAVSPTSATNQAKPGTHTKTAVQSSKMEVVKESGSPVGKILSTQELVAELWECCGMHGPVTPEQAEKFQKDLEELINRGAASVGAIREFLARNVDADFGQVPGGDQLSYSSMRAAFIDALKKIGGPEAQGAMVQALQTSAIPAELLDLANGLEAQAPGQYRGEILKAAREALEMAAANQLGTNAELGPAYRILNTYGEGGTAESSASRDPVTFTRALEMASLPNGEGLPSLLQMAQNNRPEASGRILATEMIAQLAGDNDEALKALLDMTQKEQISNRIWTRLAPILGGEQYQLGQGDGKERGPAAEGGSPNTENGAQFTMVDTARSPEQIKDRIEVIGRFLEMVQPDSAAAAALQHEQELLRARLVNL